MVKDKKIILERLDSFYEILRSRWENGLLLFEKKIIDYQNDELRENLKKNDIINTPIHNIIPIKDKYIYLLLDSIFLQRLRGIRHQGLAYLVYPTANHFRFDHSLGTYKLTVDIINSMNDRNAIDFSKYDYSEAELKVAALLHDIGHYPYSHIGENYFNNIINNPTLNFDDFEYCKIINHEERSAEIIKGNDIILGLKEIYDIETKYDNPLKKFFEVMNKYSSEKKEKINIDNLWQLIRGFNKDKVFTGNLINGPLDVDKLDYILREAYFTGTPFGQIDLHRIIEGYNIGTVENKNEEFNNQLIMNKRMLPSILQMYVGRQINYLTISHHRTVRISETMLKIVMEVTIRDLLKSIPSDDEKSEILKDLFFHFKLMEDRDLIKCLEIVTDISKRGKSLLNSFLSRTLYKNFLCDEPIYHNHSRSYKNIQDNLKLYLPTNFLDLRSSNEILDLFLRNLKKTRQKEFEELHELTKDFIDEVLILDTIHYPFKGRYIKEVIKDKMEKIYICKFINEKPEEIAYTILEDPISPKLLSFLTEIHRDYSNVIIATEYSLVQKIKTSGLCDDIDFMEDLIQIFVLYNTTYKY